MSQRLVDEPCPVCCAFSARFAAFVGSANACRLFSSRAAAPVVSREGFCCDAAFASDGCGDAAVCVCCEGAAGCAVGVDLVVCALAGCWAGGDCDGGADCCAACCCAGATAVVATDCCSGVLDPGAGGLVV